MSRTLVQAIRLLSEERGPYAISVSKLAKEIGVTRQALYSVYATRRTVEAVADRLEIPAWELLRAMEEEEKE